MSDLDVSNRAEEINLKDNQRPAYWSDDGQIYLLDGSGYGLVEVPMPPTRDGRKQRELRTVCMGKEGEVLARLADEESISEARGHDRTKRLPIRKGASRSFRGEYRYGTGLER